MECYRCKERGENRQKRDVCSYQNIGIKLDEKQISIYIIDSGNPDSASIELIKLEDFHQITFWDGYSHSEIVEAFNEKDSAKTLKRFMKKLIKSIER